MPQTRLSVTASYVQQGGEKWLDMTGTEEEKRMEAVIMSLASSFCFAAGLLGYRQF